jgi:hypothetical protein
MARRSSEAAVPLAVVAVERVPEPVGEQVQRFATAFAPGIGAGVIDSRALRSFAGHGLEAFDARPTHSARSSSPPPQRLPSLFSGLNRWMLKIPASHNTVHLPQRLPLALIRGAVPLNRAGPLGPAAADDLEGPTWASARSPGGPPHKD